ncbi:MAG TPA: hypothetical protein VFN13_00935 [Rudaea sp.]|nr:hypothetical protein [Rudaea sp.]
MKKSTLFATATALFTVQGSCNGQSLEVCTSRLNPVIPANAEVRLPVLLFGIMKNMIPAQRACRFWPGQRTFAVI